MQKLVTRTLVEKNYVISSRPWTLPSPIFLQIKSALLISVVSVLVVLSFLQHLFSSASNPLQSSMTISAPSCTGSCALFVFMSASLARSLPRAIERIKAREECIEGASDPGSAGWDSVTASSDDGTIDFMEDHDAPWHCSLMRRDCERNSSSTLSGSSRGFQSKPFSISVVPIY